MGYGPFDPINLGIAGIYGGVNLYKRFRSDDNNTSSPAMDQGTGLRRRNVRRIITGNKRFRLDKLVRSDLDSWTQNLGIQYTSTPPSGQTANTWKYKHLVSEYNPSTSGFIAIANDSHVNGTGENAKDRSWLPMHCYDLNWIMPTSTFDNTTGVDNDVNYPSLSTNQNLDINARAWAFQSTTNKWAPIRNDEGTDTTFKYIEEPRYSVEPGINRFGSTNNTLRRMKVYRNWIDIQYMLYGATNAPVEYDIRVIKIMDPKMCPDYSDNLEDIGDETHLKDFQQNWQNLIYGWCNNPMLRGIEPQPRATKRWFRTVAKKRVTIGEQTSDVNCVPVVKGSIRVRCNEVNTLAWGNNGYTVDINTALDHDDVPTVNDLNVLTSKEKPYYTSRYYLLIRANDYVVSDGGGGGIFDVNRNPISYHGSYDLVVRTKFSELGAPY